MPRYRAIAVGALAGTVVGCMLLPVGLLISDMIGFELRVGKGSMLDLALTLIIPALPFISAAALGSVSAYAANRFAVNRATEPRCDFCGYNLRGLPTGRCCPECGRFRDGRINRNGN